MTTDTCTVPDGMVIHAHPDGYQVECERGNGVIGVRWTYDSARYIAAAHAAAHDAHAPDHDAARHDPYAQLDAAARMTARLATLPDDHPDTRSGRSNRTRRERLDRDR